MATTKRKPARRKAATNPPARRRVIVHVRGTDRLEVERVNVSPFEVGKILELAWQITNQTAPRLTADDAGDDDGGA